MVPRAFFIYPTVIWHLLYTINSSAQIKVKTQPFRIRENKLSKRQINNDCKIIRDMSHNLDGVTLYNQNTENDL